VLKRLAYMALCDLDFGQNLRHSPFNNGSLRGINGPDNCHVWMRQARPLEEPTVYDKQALIDLIEELALEFGEFTLASGKKASFYLDCRKVTLHPRGANLIAEGILELLGEDFPDAIGGMAIGADPITAAVITIAGQQNKPIRGFTSARKRRSMARDAMSKGRSRQVTRL